MRKVLILAAGLALFGTLGLERNADARCVSHFVTAFPRGPLPENGRIVIEGQRASTAWVAALEKPELVGGGERIALNVESNYSRDPKWGYAQLVLVPARAPKKGATYTFSAKNVDENDRASVASWSWKIGAADNTAPTWNAAPALNGKPVREQLGCGDAVDAPVSVNASDDGASVTLYRVDVSEGGTQVLSFIAQTKDGVLHLGRGMCGGPWDPTADKAYTVAFNAMDAAGNTTAAPGASIAITAP